MWLLEALTPCCSIYRFHSAANEEDKEYTGRYLYDCDDERFEEHMDRDLLERLNEVYPGANLVTPQRSYVALDVGCVDDEEECYSVPQLVYKFK